MQIRHRLSLFFTIFSSTIMLLIMALVYLLFYKVGVTDFYHELKERAEVAAGVYLEADEISPDALKKIHEKFIISLPNEIVRMYDSSNQPAFIKDNRSLWNTAVLNQVRTKTYLQYKTGDYQAIGIRYDDNQGSFVIMVAAIDAAGKERRKSLVNILTVLFIVQLIMQFFAGRWFAKKMLLPIQKINEQVKKIKASDLHHRVDEGNNHDELTDLSANFNQLLDRLQHAFDLQKMFVANASHELKTPITAIIGEIEVALNKERSGLEYRKTLVSSLDEAEKLHQIVDNLLLLATAVKKSEEHIDEAVSVDQLLWDARARFLKESGFVLEVSIQPIGKPPSFYCITANKALLHLAIDNIIRNAFKFSDGRNVKVALTADADNLQVDITDTGIGITQEELSGIFEPFYRSANTKTYHGHGIGLYMAKEIIKRFNGSIQVQSVPHAGSTFNIRFTRKAVF